MALFCQMDNRLHCIGTTNEFRAPLRITSFHTRHSIAVKTLNVGRKNLCVGDYFKKTLDICDVDYYVVLRNLQTIAIYFAGSGNRHDNSYYAAP